MCTTFRSTHCLKERKKNYLRAPSFPGRIENVKQKMEAFPNDYLWVNIYHSSIDSPLLIEFTQTKISAEKKILNKNKGVQQ
jgi:hypothetical protein